MIPIDHYRYHHLLILPAVVILMLFLIMIMVTTRSEVSNGERERESVKRVFESRVIKVKKVMDGPLLSMITVR